MAVCFCKKSAGSCICCTVLYKNVWLWPGRSLRRLPRVTMPTKFETSARTRPPRIERAGCQRATFCMHWRGPNFCHRLPPESPFGCEKVCRVESVNQDGGKLTAVNSNLQHDCTGRARYLPAKLVPRRILQMFSSNYQPYLHPSIPWRC